MPDLWEGDTSDDAFALPGDEQQVATMIEAAAEKDPEVATALAERPRDEKGRFVPAEAEVEAPPEGTVETAEEAAVHDPTVAYLAKYGGDSAKALAAAVEAQSKIGEQAREIGELRSQQEQYEQYLTSLQQQPGPVSDWDSLIEESPAQAAEIAYRQGDQQRYNQVMQEWGDASPGTPQLWEQNKAMEQHLQQIDQRTQGFVEQAQYAQRLAAVAQLENEYPDMTAMADKMVEIAPEYPHELQALVSDDPKVVAGAMKSLYLKARGLQADTLAQTAQETARKLAQDEQSAIEAATVVSATRTNPEKPADVASQIAASWDDDERRFEGWNI